MILIAGGQAKLDFSITGDPAPTVKWLQNGEPIGDGGDGIQCVTAPVRIELMQIMAQNNFQIGPNLPILQHLKVFVPFVNCFLSWNM